MPDTPNYDAANTNAEAIIKSRIASGQFPNAEQLAQIKETELNLAAVEFVNKNPQKAQELARLDPRIKTAIDKTNPQPTFAVEEAPPVIQESATSAFSQPEPKPTKDETERRPEIPNSGKKSSKIMIMAILVLVVIAAVSGFFYMNSQNQLKMLKNNPDEITKQATDDIVDKVGKLIILPQDEEPTIATITDLEKLKDQAFFNQAQNDDKVLIYTNNKKAILYRPSTNQIVDVAPIDNQGSASPSPSPISLPTPTPQATSSAKPR